MCQMHGPSPKEVFRPTKEDQDRATESMRKFYAPRGEDARRLSRYDRAVELLRELFDGFEPYDFDSVTASMDGSGKELADEVRAFLAEEPK